MRSSMTNKQRYITLVNTALTALAICLAAIYPVLHVLVKEHFFPMYWKVFFLEPSRFAAFFVFTIPLMYIYVVAAIIVVALIAKDIFVKQIRYRYAINCVVIFAYLVYLVLFFYFAISPLLRICWESTR